MKERHDLGGARRFHQPGVVFKLPVYLTPRSSPMLSAGPRLELDELVNQLKRDIEIIEAAK
jgi:hypothetical protein